MSKSKKLFYLCLGFIVGIAVGNFWLVTRWFLAAAVGVLLLSSIFFKAKIKILILVIVFLLLGIICYQFSIPKIDENFIAFYNEQKVTFTGIVQEPDVRVDHVKLKIETKKIKIQNNWRDISGHVLVKTELYPIYNYGDEVEVCGILHQPQPIEDFRYDKYLARYGIYSTCYNSKIKVLDTDRGNFVIAKLLKLKGKINTIINKTIPEPQASFLAGILLGSRKGIPDDLMTAFNRTGVTHIIAISGYNITVISVMIMNLCLAFYLHRKRAFWVILIGIIFFTIITGASAAVVRSAIMGMIVLFAKFVGRKSKVNNILALTGVGMLAVNPKILLDDAGFQLSFLATIGLVYFVPIIEKYFKWLPKKFALQENFTTTLAAIIWTTPLILFQFKRLSIVAPVVNVLILSFIPLSMLSGFIQVLLGGIWLPAGRVAGWVSWLILEYIICVVNWFSKLSFASIEIGVNLFIMAVCYIILLCIVVIRSCRKRS